MKEVRRKPESFNSLGDALRSVGLRQSPEVVKPGAVSQVSVENHTGLSGKSLSLEECKNLGIYKELNNERSTTENI